MLVLLNIFYLGVIKINLRVIYRILLRENRTWTACLVGSGLKLIFHRYAHWEISVRSWFNSSAEIVGSFTIENSDVSSAKNLTLDLIPLSKSFM